MGHEEKPFFHNHQIDCGEHQNLLGEKRNVISDVVLRSSGKNRYHQKILNDNLSTDKS